MWFIARIRKRKSHLPACGVETTATTIVCVFLIFRISHITLHGILSVSTVFLDADDTRPGRFQQVRFSSNVEDFACDNNTELLVMVATKADEYDRRVSIRKTWGSPLRFNATATRLLFVTGIIHYHNNDEENADFRDMILTNIREKYQNLALKTFAALFFAQRYCPRVKCLVKADSDNFLNIPALERYCRQNHERPSILGRCNISRKVIRNRFVKWYVPPHVYGPNQYPRYCSTGAYMFLGRETPIKLLNALPHTGFYESENMRRMSEDVIFTGIVPSMLSLPRIHSDGFNFYESPTTECDESTKRQIAYSIHAPDEIDAMFRYETLLSASGDSCQ
ncbi:hypothetical protein L596_018963 [Steinernema carpocapsae]|uniref:Hexosyltransferase n=1 Tax=Steinernema carpocapsae TaxID=34508 RepID=A0A4U5N6X4_STECR|nr:hypothetical protein L596_018963 [Steinernema carpocapsae]